MICSLSNASLISRIKGGTLMEIIATVAGVITSLGMIFGMIFAVYKWFLKQEK